MFSVYRYWTVAGRVALAATELKDKPVFCLVTIDLVGLVATEFGEVILFLVSGVTLVAS